VSYSITVRLEVPSRGRAVSELTHAVEHAGMLVAAARALAGVVSPAELGPHYIIPSVFHPDVASAVAAAVRDAAGGRPSRS
jgi:malate dehydrogenase (oxaloacetate-decarboxylating)